MYILCKLEKRAETTDTIIYYVAKKRNSLEELLLSLYEELIENDISKDLADKYINSYQIIYVPLLDN